MNNRAFVQTIILAAVIFVLFPLLALSAMMTTHFGFELLGAPIGALFPDMGPLHFAMLAWLLAAFVIVLLLVAFLLRDTMRHA